VWPRLVGPNATILSVQQLVVTLGATIAPVFPSRVTLAFGRIVSPLYGRRRFVGAHAQPRVSGTSAAIPNASSIVIAGELLTDSGQPLVTDTGEPLKE
jgi:hypothetical protein